MLRTTLLILSLILLLEISAHAYVDGGTGSYVLQIAVAALWGVGFAFRDTLRRVLVRIRRGNRDAAGTRRDG